MAATVYNLTLGLLGDLWNKIKRDSSVPAPSISKDDIVILVLGPTGSGKSWFIKEATKVDFIKSSRGYHPFTIEVQAVRCELTDEAKTGLRKEGIKSIKSIVFVDTPSFLTECDDIDAQRELKAWIDRTEHKAGYLGAIYMHRIETDPELEPIRNHLQELTSVLRLGGSQQPLHIHIVVSYDRTSGTVTPSKIVKHESNLRAQMDALNRSSQRWRLSMHQVQFQGASEVAWGAVEELLVGGA